MVTQYDGRKAELLNALFVYCRFIASGVSLTPHIPGEKTQGCAQITKWFLYSSRTLICLAFSPRPAWRKYNLTAGILKPFCLTAKPNKANVTCHPGFRICFIGFIKRQRVVLLQIPSKYHFASKKANQKKKTGSALLIHNWNVLVLSEAVKDLIFHCVKQPRRQRGGIYVHCNKNKHSRCWSDLCCGKKKCYVSLVGGGGDRNKDKDVWARFRFYFDTTHCYKRARLLCFVFYFHMKKNDNSARQLERSDSNRLIRLAGLKQTAFAIWLEISVDSI